MLLLLGIPPKLIVYVFNLFQSSSIPFIFVDINSANLSELMHILELLHTSRYISVCFLASGSMFAMFSRSLLGMLLRCCSSPFKIRWPLPRTRCTGAPFIYIFLYFIIFCFESISWAPFELHTNRKNTVPKFVYFWVRCQSWRQGWPRPKWVKQQMRKIFRTACVSIFQSALSERSYWQSLCQKQSTVCIWYLVPPFDPEGGWRKSCSWQEGRLETCWLAGGYFRFRDLRSLTTWPLSAEGRRMTTCTDLNLL